MRFWTTGVLRQQSVHQDEHDLRADVRVSVNFRDARAAERGWDAEPSPVINIRNSDVIETAGDAIADVITHHRQVDDLGYFIGHDFREMTEAAGVFGLAQQRGFAPAEI